MPGIIKSPKVSIIMPTYNRAKYIVDTIESIRDQTYQNWELIIVDDGSNDNTGELINQIKDDRIKFYKAGRIGIGGKIKNLGLERAGGELIAFIDSDDLWAPTKLEKQVDLFEEYPEAGFCLTGGYNFKVLNEPVDFFYKQKEGIRFDKLFVSIFRSEVAAFSQALVMRVNCLDVTGNFKETKSFSDVDFIVNLSWHFKGVILYEPLVFRRLHEDNYIHDNWEKSDVEGIEILKSNQERLPRNIVMDAWFRLYINFGENCLQHRQKRKAMFKFIKAWKYKPFSIVPFKKIAKAILY